MSFRQIESGKYRGIVKRLVKVVIGLVVYGADEVLGFLKTILGIRSSGVAVAIYYHQVSRADRARFALQMDHLLRWAIPVRAAEAGCSDDKPSWQVAVTADDVWLSFVENALPELEKRKIPSTLFVVSHRLGERLDEVRNSADPGDRLISESELVKLPRELVTIGSHTATHPHLTSLPVAVIRDELLESRIRLSQLLAADVSLICFPYGDYDESTIALSRTTGYVRAFGAQTTPMAQSHDAFLIERVRVDPTDWPIEFHLKLMNAYRIISFVVKVKRRARAALSRLNSAAPSEPFARYRGNATTDRYSDARK